MYSFRPKEYHPGVTQTKDIDPDETQAAQERRRRGYVRPVDRKEPIDPRRRLGLEMIRQSIQDLKDVEYKGESKDPDPKAWLRGDVDGWLEVEQACKMAEVSVRRVRKRAHEIIREANGPLSERDYATQEELDADSHDWIAVGDLGINNDTVSNWANREMVTALKVHPKDWRIRVDEKLRGRFEEYREHRRSRGVEVPPLGKVL